MGAKNTEPEARWIPISEAIQSILRKESHRQATLAAFADKSGVEATDFQKAVSRYALDWPH